MHFKKRTLKPGHASGFLFKYDLTGKDNTFEPRPDVVGNFRDFMLGLPLEKITKYTPYVTGNADLFLDALRDILALHKKEANHD